MVKPAVKAWRRSYHDTPPQMALGEPEQGDAQIHALWIGTRNVIAQSDKMLIGPRPVDNRDFILVREVIQAPFGERWNGPAPICCE